MYVCVCVCVCVSIYIYIYIYISIYLSRGKSPRKLPKEDLISKLRAVWFPNLRFLFYFFLVGENIGLFICTHRCLGFTKEGIATKKKNLALVNRCCSCTKSGALLRDRFPPQGDLSYSGIKPRSPALQADSLLFESPGKPPDRFRFVAQMVKNSPSVQETQVQFLDPEVPLEKGMATHSSILQLPWWIWRLRIHLQCRRPGFDSWVGKIHLEKGIATQSSVLA